MHIDAICCNKHMIFFTSAQKINFITKKISLKMLLDSCFIGTQIVALQSMVKSSTMKDYIKKIIKLEMLLNIHHSLSSAFAYNH